MNVSDGKLISCPIREIGFQILGPVFSNFACNYIVYAFMYGIKV